jgi:hypothetical protein
LLSIRISNYFTQKVIGHLIEGLVDGVKDFPLLVSFERNILDEAREALALMNSPFRCSPGVFGSRGGRHRDMISSMPG